MELFSLGLPQYVSERLFPVFLRAPAAEWADAQARTPSSPPEPHSRPSS